MRRQTTLLLMNYNATDHRASPPIIGGPGVMGFILEDDEATLKKLLSGTIVCFLAQDYK